MDVKQKIEKYLLELIEDNKNKYNIYNSLWNELECIIDSSNDHLKQITAQLHDYDIHDEEHSSKVLNNIELLLDDSGINKLTWYELILLYTSSFLHDAAMALPQWEYQLLNAVEGTKECYDNKQIIYLRNDFRPMQKLSEVVDFIINNKQEIYGDFKDVSNFIFSPSNEEDFQIDLAERIRDYEEFRSGYSYQLKDNLETIPRFLNYSELLRSEYIRITHHIRVEKYILNLKRRLEKIIGTAKAERFVVDLSLICRSHGEDFLFVQKLNCNSELYENDYANLQYISILLRLGDVIHFSSDRAPFSLFSEKKITDSISLKHWTAKFQDLKYDIKMMNEKKVITFFAYCTTPEIYYFIQDYIDWIDQELNNYYSFLHNLEFLNYENIGNYKLPLELSVDRKNIEPNKDVFMPEKDLKFTLDQSKILKLLMGVQLYKDKYLSLRELYQNAMDACRCMIAQNKTIGVIERFKIEFGIKEYNNNGKTEKYIYCIDNGIGMTKEIVKNYLLKIGNSYYKSNDFMRKNTNWDNDVMPTSQFGIGILSCYMIASKIEITTKYHDSKSDIFSFALEGANERFYYMNPNKLDSEKIGTHGTLIKIYLNDECSKEINNYFPERIEYLIHGRSNKYLDESSNQKEKKEKFIHSLFYLLNKQIGIPKQGITVQVRDNDNNIQPLIPWYEIFDYRKYEGVTVEDVEALWQEYFYFDESPNPYKDIARCREYIKEIPLYVTDGNVEIYSFIGLPLMNIPVEDVKVFDYCNFIWKNDGVLIDGIVTAANSVKTSLETALGEEVLSKSLVNFIGEIRPILSIDRNNIISIPESLIKKCEGLLPKFMSEVILQVQRYFSENNISPDSQEANLIIDILVRRFPKMASEIINGLKTTNTGEIRLCDLEDETNKKNRIVDIIKNKYLELNNFDIRDKRDISQNVIIGKMIAASEILVKDSNIRISSEGFMPIPYYNRRFSEGNALSTLVVKADNWSGVYHEYDLVSNIWPIVPSMLFEGLIDDHDNRVLIENRAKALAKASNGIAGIAQLDPALINPKFGISTKSLDRYRGKKCYVGECEHIQNKYWLFELNNHGELVKNQKKDFVLFAFIAPRKLNDEEEIRLLDFKDNDEVYIKGVREGWSILFLGNEEKYFILPGIVSKSDIIKQIPNSIRNKNKVVYYNLDGSRTF